MILKNENARVAIYVRVSTTYQVDKDSLPMQRQDLIAYAKLMLNTEDCEIFEDAGYSGKNTDRPKYQEMMKQIRDGKFTHLLVWKIDRISRNLLDFAAMYQELKKLGVIFVSKNEQFDTSTAMGEAMLKIILVFAELERNMTSERVTATMISRASNGLWNGGRVPYGYNYDSEKMEFSINESEAEVVKLIHDKYETISSLVKEARWLNNNKFRTRAGSDWSPVSLHTILTSVFYCGDYRYNVLNGGDRRTPNDSSEWITVNDHHVAIISREQKERIIALLESNKRTHVKRGVRKSSHTHIFQGICMCGNCGKYMTSTISERKSNDYRYSKYLCPTKRTSNIRCVGKSTSDPVVGEVIFNFLLNMFNARKNYTGSTTAKQLEKMLLSGATFNYVERIEHEDLLDILYTLGQELDADLYKADADVPNFKPSETELSSLKSEKQKIERAIDRLRNLYLYDENAMPEAEYILQHKALTDRLDELNANIKNASRSDDWSESVTDEELLFKFSRFIIVHRLKNRSYVNFKRLHLSVDSEVLKTFIQSIVDTIMIRDGKVQQIIFKNGLSCSFVLK